MRLSAAGDRAETVEIDGGGYRARHSHRITCRTFSTASTGCRDRATAPGPEQGLGLGLSFVAWIVKAHDGTIDVDSTPGKGTRFTVRIPSSGVGADTIESVVGMPGLRAVS